HLHSAHSDGKLAPAELVRLGQAAGVAALALTDHDSIRGIPEARAACREAGIIFVPGIELGVGVGEDEVHLLGYGIDAKGRTLQHNLDLLAGERLDRMEKMIAALGRQGVPISLDAVRAETGGGIVGRPHLAAALVRAGHAADLNEAFRRWIGTGRPAYVRRHLLNLREAIDLIREAGGVPVLAHPGVTRRDELIEYLVRLGVRGLEVYYPKHDFVDVSRYRKMCAKFDLIATGGSDFHGAGKDEPPVGSMSTPPDEFYKLMNSMNI
ncbi:MAG TPA: PHP domain-containing protein, partial [Candidatus Methanoperedens sp.]|nr:PHP domain-containing protein [Candidatus Methanoperedens sp.]